MLILQHRPTMATEIQTLRFQAAAITRLRPTVVAVDSRPQARILVGKVALLRPATITEVVVGFLLAVMEEVALAPPTSKVALTSCF